MRIRWFANLMFISAWLAGTAALQQQSAGSGPTLRLEKPVYVAGESIRFWVGVTSDVDIPEDLRQSCVLHIRRPDGTTHDERVSWPMDGDPSRGWEGGSGLGEDAPSPGRYVVSFEFAGKRTAEQSVDVVTNPVTKGIEASWVFFDSKSGGPVHERGVLLHVENKTGRVLRFAKPGLMGSEVWVTVEGFEPASSESIFVPQSALLQKDEIPSFAFDTLNWTNQSQWSMVTVPDGGSSDRALILGSIYPSFQEGKEYEMTIETVLTVFVGEPGDPDAQLYPLRIPIMAKAWFRWP